MSVSIVLVHEEPEKEKKKQIDEIAMNKANQLVVFTLCKQRFAIDISHVERIIRINKLNLKTGSSIACVNLLRFQGRIIPLINIRKRFNLPECSSGKHDHILIANAFGKRHAIMVDSVMYIIRSTKKELVRARNVSRDFPGCEGLLKLSDGTLLIQDLDKLLSLEEKENEVTDLIGRVEENDFNKWFRSKLHINWGFTSYRKDHLRYFN